MSGNSTLPDLGELASKLEQLVRSGELKVAGKLLATARGHLHQIAEKEPTYKLRYEQVAELRNDLMEPGNEDFNGKELLVKLLAEGKELRKAAAECPCEQVGLAHMMLHAAAAVVLVHCQGLESDAPLDF